MAKYVLSSTVPSVPPAILVTEIVAGGNEQVGEPPCASVNFTGTTPREALKMLLPSALIGDCTNALYPGVCNRSVIVLSAELTTAISGRPSPLKSPTASECGALPTV